VKINTTIRFLQNSQVEKLILSALILCFTQQFRCYSQNLYDLEQSRNYAEYLFSSRQFKLASEEYERLIYFDRNNQDFKYSLIKSHRLSGDIALGISRVYSLYGSSLDTIPQSLAIEFVKLQLLSDSIQSVKNFILQNNTLSSENKATYNCCTFLLEGEYNNAIQCMNIAATKNYTFPPVLKLVTENAEQTKLKSPFIAAGLSTLLPGTGKIYTRNWSDGLFSMLFIAGNTWQAYRGFNEKGIKSTYGWVFAGLSASFYIGNIFGSAKAAKRYNKVKKDEINNQILDFIRSDSF